MAVHENERNLLPTWPGKSRSPVVAATSEKQMTEKTAVGPVAALLFEFDNILCDATHWQRWLWQVLSRVGVQRDFENFSRIWQRGYLVEVQRGGRDFAEALRMFLVDWGLPPGQIDELEHASAARRREMIEHLRPLPGVVSTLGRLADAGMTLAILANSEWTAQELIERIEHLGLGRQFRVVLSSRDLGSLKPEPASYASALDVLGLPPQAVGFVGCAAEHLQGAADIGLQTVAVNCPAAEAASHRLAHFEELTNVCLPATVANV
jgi:HAD superfamily hydrolase (TIGR01509 family)